ncbi:MAG TPA: DUF6049 family protein [Actinomycetota bacterium]|nr:DUF6049 family protein [Actinomycetota bacterium]
MGRIRVRGARALLPFVVVSLVVGLATSIGPVPRVARAQTEARVTLELLSQTAWVGPTDDRFGLRVLARNIGASSIGDLDVRLTLGPPFTSRTDYEEWLLPGTPTTATYSLTERFDGSIAPGAVRQFPIVADPSTIDVLPATDSRVHPLLVEVRSGGDVVGSLNTSLVWIARDPERPVSFSWWTEFDAPLPLGPDGRLVARGFEAAIGETGSLTEQVDALARLAEREVPIDLVVRPALLDHLMRMSDGYERADGVRVPSGSGPAQDAAELLDALGRAARAETVQVSALPFAGPSIPSFLAGGLHGDLEAQRLLATATTDAALGVTPAMSVARPPGGALSDDALAWLAGRGATTILADADTVERPPQDNEFAFPSTATVATSRGDVTLVLPDPGTQALLSREDLLTDPVRAAQAVFAELAVVWRESPVPPDQPDGTPTQRGLALQVPSSMPTQLWRQLSGRLAAAPFLTPRHAQDHVGAVVPVGPAATLTAPGADPPSSSFVSDVRRLRRDVEAMSSMYLEPSPQTERLRRNLFVAESAASHGDETAGRSWLDAVAAETAAAFGSVTPSVQVFTLTSRDGDIPLLVGTGVEVPTAVTIELEASLLAFPEGNVREVTLQPGRPQVVTFPVVSSGARTYDVVVVVRAPSGRAISEQSVRIRSTALNAIALAVTGAAALVLVVLWLRRWTRRRSAVAAA